MAHTYDFISKSITRLQVKNIITQAGYKPAGYSYSPRVDDDGFLVTGNAPMALAPLRNAAKALKIKVEISSGAGADNVSAGLAAAADSAYQVNLTLSQATVLALQGGGYNLYGFKAVQSTMKSGAPLVWFSMPATNLLTTNNIGWTEQYQAYISNTLPVAPNTTVVASATVDISLGQQWNVEPGGGDDVTTAGPAIAISINNTTKTPFSCGVSMEQNGVFNPLCAFPLYGGGLDVIAPIEKIVLIFSTLPVNTGTVIEQAFSPGIFIDLTADNQRSVAFDINQGWSWDGGSWGQQIPANSTLIPFLVEPPSPKLRAAALEAGAGRETATRPEPTATPSEDLAVRFAPYHAEPVAQN